MQLADDSEEVPKLKNKSYSDFKLSRDDWDRLVLMHEVLHINNIIIVAMLCFRNTIPGACTSPAIILEFKRHNCPAHDSNPRVFAGNLKYYGTCLKIYRDSAGY